MTDMSEIAKVFTENGRRLIPTRFQRQRRSRLRSYMLVANAIKAAGSAEPAAIRDALPRRRTSRRHRQQDINETHDAESPVGIVQIQGRKRTVHRKPSSLRCKGFLPQGSFALFVRRVGKAPPSIFLKSGGTLMSGKHVFPLFSTQ